MGIEFIAQGIEPVDYLGSAAKGVALGRNITDNVDYMSAKRALKNAQQSGDPYQLGAALNSAQVSSPEYAQNVSVAQTAPAIALGKQQEAFAQDRAHVAMQALQAPPEVRSQLLTQEANELVRNGMVDDAHHVMSLLNLPYDQQTQQLQAHLQAAQGQQAQTSDIQNYEYGVRDPNFADYQQQKNKSNEAYGQLYAAQDMQGKPIQFQLSKNGVPMVMGGGNPQINPKTVMPITFDPELNRNKNYSGESGTQQAQVEAVAPKEEQTNAAKRQSTYIDDGLEAADRIPELNRISTLLDSTKTGGIDKLKLYAKQNLGIESGDEAELSAGLGKAVVKQYRETFGAAFTENEGNKLDSIEAGFGKSVEGNKRLIAQLRNMLERKAKRGIRAAEDRGDIDTAEEIKSAMAVDIVTPKVMTKDQLQKAADELWQGDTEKAKLDAAKHGYIIE